MQKTFWLCTLLCFGTAGCDLFEHSKSQVEEHYLSQHQGLKTAIEKIREQGLESTLMTAKEGSMLACVARNIERDPFGPLITVEGSLQESAKLIDFSETIDSLTEQELSFESLPQIIRLETDTLNYLSTLLDSYDLRTLQHQTSVLMQNGLDKSQDLGSHLRGLVEQCE
ncbi:hypothetical protein [Pseudoalteromonas sp. S16_S37]|uniref:hypothetical protein n=1 Tax=Pseudoalteromonas sp. S16_S37 TaxID=2720228 RepID=UPI001680F8AC|nr:hypothetical protein [Pseudoalteromonas sp. S16_S37]MBD1581463.1 hypothetical protein [Pseudoalteromonas sp. S16_S37]